MIVTIYEDELKFQEILRNKLIALQLELDVEYDIQVIKTTDELLEINQKDDIIINIVDIEHDNENKDGITVGKLLKNINPEANIIYYTTHIEKTYVVLNSFIEPLAYIYKDDQNLSLILKQAIKKVLQRLTQSKSEKTFVFKSSENDNFYVKENEIYFIQTHPARQKYLVVYLYDKKITVKGILSNFIEQSDQLIQISKSTIVNKTKIKSIKKDINPKNKVIHTGVKDKDDDKLCILTPKYKQNLL